MHSSENVIFLVLDVSEKKAEFQKLYFEGKIL